MGIFPSQVSWSSSFWRPVLWAMSSSSRMCLDCSTVVFEPSSDRCGFTASKRGYDVGSSISAPDHLIIISAEEGDDKKNLEGDVVAKEDGNGDLEAVLPVDLQEAEVRIRMVAVQLHL